MRLAESPIAVGAERTERLPIAGLITSLLEQLALSARLWCLAAFQIAGWQLQTASTGPVAIALDEQGLLVSRDSEDHCVWPTVDA
jgi:hypothetical protein